MMIRKAKKVIAFVMSLALLNCDLYANSTDGLFRSDTVSAYGFVTYDLEATLEDNTIMIAEGQELNNACLINNGIIINEIVGYCHDMPDDPLFGLITKSDVKRSVSLKDCNVKFPENVKEGENTITISFCNYNTVSVQLTVNVVYCDPIHSEAVDTLEDDYIYLKMTNSVVKPGDETYVDINISDSIGFSSLLFGLEYDHDVFTLENLSAMPEFIQDYSFTYNKEQDNIILMSDQITNNKEYNLGNIRLKFRVNENTPDGDYKISFSNTKDKFQLVTMRDNKIYHFMNRSLVPGTVTVSKTADSQTNLYSMSLDRVYAQSNDLNGIIDSKTGDLTQDGNIDKNDVLKFSDYLLGSEDKVKNADTTEDGKIDIADYVNIKSFVAQE